MTVGRRWRANCAFTLVVWSAMHMNAATIDSVQYTPAFYRVEMVVFSRDGYVSPPGGEILESTAPRQFESPLHAFGVDDRERASIYRLEEPDELTPFPGDPPSTELPPDRAPAVAQAAAPLTPKQQVEQAIADLESQWLAESLRLRGTEELQLSKLAQRLERAGATRVIWHGAWLQQVPDRDREPHQPVLVQLGGWTNEGWEVEGEVDVTRGRFLHFETSLWFRSPPGYIELTESRRMRSAELNYLDHPKYGVLVRIDPMTLPADLVAAIEALDE